MTAQELAILVGGPSPSKEGKGWTITAPDGHMTWTVIADAASDKASWIIAHPDRPLRLKELVALFGPYRKLPPGEYTWIRFEAFLPTKVAVSAQVSLAAIEADSRVVRIQFQKPQ